MYQENYILEVHCARIINSHSNQIWYNLCCCLWSQVQKLLIFLLHFLSLLKNMKKIFSEFCNFDSAQKISSQKCKKCYSTEVFSTKFTFWTFSWISKAFQICNFLQRFFWDAFEKSGLIKLIYIRCYFVGLTNFIYFVVLSTFQPNNLLPVSWH